MTDGQHEESAGRVAGTASRMTGEPDGARVDDQLLVEAAEWLVQLTSRTATEEDAERIAQWREQSAEHEAAFREVAGVRSYAVIASRTKKPVSRRALLSAGGGGAIALLAGLGLARPPLGLWPSYAELMADHRTAVGGRLAIQPVDGVQIELSSRTSVSLIGEGRGIRLINGKTFVSANPRTGAFMVEAGRLSLTTEHAEFNVQSLDNHDRVACVRGVLRCVADGEEMRISANEALTLTSEGLARRSRVDAAKESAWRRGLLIFEGTPLSEVIDQLNLYRPGRIVLNDPNLGRVPLNAVFHTAQIENAVPQVAQLLELRARHLAGGIIILG